jgi:hypothetical protein
LQNNTCDIGAFEFELVREGGSQLQTMLNAEGIRRSSAHTRYV